MCGHWLVVRNFVFYRDYILVMKSLIMATKCDGDLRVYCDAKQGGRVYMEDVICIQSSLSDKHDAGGRTRNSRECLFFAVFDGHGGPEAAQFAEKNLKDEILRQPTFWSDNDEDVIRAIKDGYISTHNLMQSALGPKRPLVATNAHSVTQSLKLSNVDPSWPQTLGGLPSTAGTTASVVILRDGKVYVSHVGDSSVVFGESEQSSHSSADGKLTAKCVTVEHKPDCDEERMRIEQCGGEVISKAGVSRVVWKRPRVMLMKGLLRRHSTGFDSIPFLAVSRSLGDLWSYNSERGVYVVSPEPDVSVYKLDRNLQRFLIIASDGVWNMMSAEDAVNCVWSSVKSQNFDDDNSENSCTENPAATLVRNALDRWRARCMRADNTSAIIVLLQPPEAIKESAPAQAKTKSSLTVKMSFNRRVPASRKSVFLTRPRAATRRMHWSRSLSVSIVGKVGRRIRKLPTVSGRAAASAKKLVSSVLLKNGAVKYLTDRRRRSVLASRWSSLANLSERSNVTDTKHVIQKANIPTKCITMDSFDNSRHPSRSHSKPCAPDGKSNVSMACLPNDFGFTGLTSICRQNICKINVDGMLESGRVLLNDASDIGCASVSLHSDLLGSAVTQNSNVDWIGCCSASDSCSSIARRQHDFTERTPLQQVETASDS